MTALIAAVAIISGLVPGLSKKEAWYLEVEQTGGLTPELVEVYRTEINPPAPPIVLPAQPRPRRIPPAQYPPGVEQWRTLVSGYPWPVDIMLDVMRCESGGLHTAASHTDDHGLLQIHYPIWGPHFGVTRQQLYDPALNIDLAYRIYQAQGLTAWVCYKKLYL